MAGFRGSRDRDRILHTQVDVEEAARAIRNRIPAIHDPLHPESSPRVGFVLGSGLGDFVLGLEDPVSVPFALIPGFSSSGVAGHPGRLVFGRRAGIPVLVQAGRFHLYEGLGPSEVAFPVRVFHALGVRVLVLTNAAGGVDPHLRPGDLLLLDDHIHFQFRNPLRGRGPLVDRSRFVDLARPYAPRLLEAARAAALAVPVPRVQTGTYWSTLGPAYETPAEVRMIRRLGGDAVGMSTVNEVLVARQLDLEVLGIACIANLAAGLGPSRLSHEDVLRTVAGTADRLGRLLDATLPALARPSSAA